MREGVEIAVMIAVFALFLIATTGHYMYAQPKRPALDALFTYWPANYEALDRGDAMLIAPYGHFLTCWLVTPGGSVVSQVSTGGSPPSISWWVLGRAYGLVCR